LKLLIPTTPHKLGGALKILRLHMQTPEPALALPIDAWIKTRRYAAASAVRR
jgi:hypothetical protein